MKHPPRTEVDREVDRRISGDVDVAEGHVVDTGTGELLRALRTGRACLRCQRPIQRRGRTGRQPARCAGCQADRERATDASRKRVQRERAREVQAAAKTWLASDRSDADNFALFVPRAEYIAGLGLDDDEWLPLVIDRDVDDDGRARQPVPRGWYSDAGPAEGSTLPPGSSTWETIYGRNGLAQQAARCHWFSENPGWRQEDDEPRSDATQERPGKQIQERAAA